jgi:hypothetical protein
VPFRWVAARLAPCACRVFGGSAGHGFAQADTMLAAMGHLAVAFVVPRLGALLVRELRLAGLATDLDDREPRGKISPEDYERLAVRVEQRYGADVPALSSLEPPGQPKKKKKRRRRSPYAQGLPTARCVFLARALMEVCAFERDRAAYECVEFVVPLYIELNESYRRRREHLTAAQARLDPLGSTPFDSKEGNEQVASLKATIAARLQATPLPDESVVAPPIKTQKEVSMEYWDRVSSLLGETGLHQDDLAPILYVDFDSNPSQVKNRLGQKVFRAGKRRVR